MSRKSRTLIVRPLLTLVTVYQSLRRTGGGGGIDADDVQTALGLRSRYLAERLLVALGDDFESPEDFVHAARRKMAAPLSDKIAFLFEMYDADGDGYINRQEVRRLIHLAVAENGLRMREGQIESLVDTILKEGDLNRDDQISPADFAVMVKAHPALEKKLESYGVSFLMPGRRARLARLLPGSRWAGWVRNELVLQLWLIGYLAANLLLFTEALLRYREAGANLYVQIARGCGACLNLNLALIVVPMLRHTLTRVRRSAFGRFVPVDDAADLHRLIGEVATLQAIVHTVAHALNQWPAWLEGHNPAPLANATGAVILLAMLVMWACAREAVRRSRRFELFHLSHLAYWPVAGLMFLHGPNFWLWGTAPWLWYVVERALRARRSQSQSEVERATALPSGVTRIDFARPPGFAYAPGDYVFLCIPSVARAEWHPFTLTSAPEQAATLSVHARNVGNWTAALRERLPELVANAGPVPIRLDGPYGTASRLITQVPHAVAIAGGIGVTPFASILQSLLLRQQDPNAEPFELQKLRFIWLNREQEAFGWFADLLAELDERDRTGILDLHTFVTAGRSDMTGSLLDLGQTLWKRDWGRDPFTGLCTHTHLGRPDFDAMLQQFIGESELPKPEVFFCGPAPLGRQLARTCQRLGLRFRYERF